MKCVTSMENLCNLTLLLIFPIIILTLLFTKPKSKLPPGPKPWPIIGNILHLGDKPHQSLAKLAKIYGPIMSLKLGSITTIVISSPQVAQEMFIKHDLALSSRPIPDATRAENHHTYSMPWLPVCSKWRTLRKIATIHLLTSQKLNATENLRHTKVKELIDHVHLCCETGVPVDIGKAGFTASLNLLSNTIFSIDLGCYGSSKSLEFKDLVWNILKAAGRANVSDVFPVLRRLDLQGTLRRSRRYFKKMIGIFEEIIEERLKDSMDVKEDVLGTLLKLVSNQELSLDDVKHLLVDLFIAGTETTSVTLEWAMTELLRNPNEITKAQMEMDQELGKDHLVQESDINKLPYLQSIVKETFRLHPPGPFLIPHKAENDVQLCGYLVPKNSSIWVNIWSIGRDSSAWPEPELFVPKRFLDKKIDVKGQDFELIPFGSGRRLCPGIPLAHRMLHLMLASLLHTFNWKYAHGSSSNDVHVEEKFGMSLQRVEPLEAIPFLR